MTDRATLVELAGKAQDIALRQATRAVDAKHPNSEAAANANEWFKLAENLCAASLRARSREG